MTNDELNDKVFEKIDAELTARREQLLSIEKEELYEYTYVLAVCEDAMLTLYDHYLSDKECLALLQSSSILDDVLSEWENNTESLHMRIIRETIKNVADNISRNGGKYAVDTLLEDGNVDIMATHQDAGDAGETVSSSAEIRELPGSNTPVTEKDELDMRTDNEKLNTKLYEKMFEEQEKYRDWLLSQSPEEILNHTYEYTMREDILMCLEYNDLTDKQCKALLKSPCPLGDVFKKWENHETKHLDDIRDTIESRANDVIRKDFVESRKER